MIVVNESNDEERGLFYIYCQCQYNCRVVLSSFCICVDVDTIIDRYCFASMSIIFSSFDNCISTDTITKRYISIFALMVFSSFGNITMLT